MIHFRLNPLYFNLFSIFCFGSNFVLSQTASILSPNAQISLLTISPGNNLYAAFGHTGIRIKDPAKDIDWVYNYGTFDSDTPWFYFKFIRGQLDYQLSVAYYETTYQHYRVQKRSIIEQVLNISPEHKNNIFTFLRKNYLPENRNYRYDFFFDNCSTRPRDVFEIVLDSTLKFQSGYNTELSFRHLLDPYIMNRPLIDLGIDIALGQSADDISTAREEMFLPFYLMSALENAMVTYKNEDQPHAFVMKTDTLYWVSTETDLQGLDWLTIMLWLMFGCTTAWTIKDYRSNRMTISGIRTLPDIMLFGLIGMIGLILLFLWFGTEHTVTANNWNLLWAWPTHFIIVFSLISGKQERWHNWYLIITIISVGISLVVWSYQPQTSHIPFK